MKHISSLVNTSSISVKREERKFDNALDPYVTAVVNKLFVFFYSICRGFDKQYHDPKRLNAEKTQWIRAFMDVGFTTLQHIQLGVRKCRLESPINTPTIGQFVKWCTPTPKELGIPALEEAYAEACKNSLPYDTEKKWSHPAVYHAYTMCDAYELMTLPKKNTFPIFERNYDITVKMLMQGENLREIPKAITCVREYPMRQKTKSQFGHCNSYASAKAEMEKLLGTKINANSDKGRVQKNFGKTGI